jgi:probable HAF family extracellular repeat protein
MRGSIALRKTIATHPRMIALVAATVAGCLALFMAFVWGLVGASPASAASTTYAVKDLGTLGCCSPDVDDINASGQVVGSNFTSTTGTHAFLYEAGVMNDLGVPPDANCSLSRAFGINDSGQVVGESLCAGLRHLFLYSKSTGMKDLGLLPGAVAGTNSQAFDINASGQVVGYSGSSAGEHAFLWADDGDPNTIDMKDLGTLGGFHSYAYGINDSGQVVGIRRSPPSALLAILTPSCIQTARCKTSTTLYPPIPAGHSLTPGRSTTPDRS